jgi:tetratricopeptide (TPR) repeat protein
MTKFPVVLFLISSLLGIFTYPINMPAQDRVAALEALTNNKIEIHKTSDALKIEVNRLQNQYQELEKQYNELSQEITGIEQIIHHLQIKKLTNNRGKKDDFKARKEDEDDDKKIDKEIKLEQLKISKLRELQIPLMKDGELLKQEGIKTLQKLEVESKKLAQWYHDWAFICDLVLSDDVELHRNQLEALRQKTLGQATEHWQLAYATAEAGTRNYETALSVLKPLVKHALWKGKATTLRAYIYALQGEILKAGGEFDRSVKLDNRDPLYYLLRSRFMGLVGKWKDAKRHADNALELAPNAPAVLSWRAIVYAYQHEPSKEELKIALESAETIVTQTKRLDWFALEALAAAQASHGDFVNAEKTQKEALEVATGTNKEICSQHLKEYSVGILPTRTLPLK